MEIIPRLPLFFNRLSLCYYKLRNWEYNSSGRHRRWVVLAVVHQPDEAACYVIDRLEFHRSGMELSNVQTRRGNEAAGTEIDMDKCPKGQRECIQSTYKSLKIKTSSHLNYKKNDCHFIEQVYVYVTNILTVINLIFTFYSGYWLSLSPIGVFGLNYQ